MLLDHVFIPMHVHSLDPDIRLPYTFDDYVGLNDLVSDRVRENARDSFGEAELAAGDLASAERDYGRSLHLNPEAAARKLQ
jgi:hypothetical protein